MEPSVIVSVSSCAPGFLFSEDRNVELRKKNSGFSSAALILIIKMFLFNIDDILLETSFRHALSYSWKTDDPLHFPFLLLIYSLPESTTITRGRKRSLLSRFVVENALD